MNKFRLQLGVQKVVDPNTKKLVYGVCITEVGVALEFQTVKYRHKDYARCCMVATQMMRYVGSLKQFDIIETASSHPNKTLYCIYECDLEKQNLALSILSMGKGL